MRLSEDIVGESRSLISSPVAVQFSVNEAPNAVISDRVVLPINDLTMQEVAALSAPSPKLQHSPPAHPLLSGVWFSTMRRTGAKTTSMLFERTPQPPIFQDNFGRADAEGRSLKPKRPARPPPGPPLAIPSIARGDCACETPSSPPFPLPLAAPPILAPIAPIHVQSSDTGGRAKLTQLDPRVALMEEICKRGTFKPTRQEEQVRHKPLVRALNPSRLLNLLLISNNPLISMIRFEILSSIALIAL